MKSSFGHSTARAAMLMGMAVWLCHPSVASASVVTLGTAQSFAVLGASTVTNTGPTIISGSLGLWAGSSITGFASVDGGPGTVVNGAVDQTNALAHQAQSDETTAYLALAGLPSTGNLTGQDLGGLTLTPGVYTFSSEAQLTGTLTLNFEDLPNAVFVFQIGSTLTTASSSLVDVTNGVASDSIFWQVGSSATLGTTTTFAGNILALDSITLTTGAKIECGRAFAQTGAVTLDTNDISNNCSIDNFGSGATDYGSNGFSGVPEPGTFLLLGIGLAGFVVKARLKP